MAKKKVRKTKIVTEDIAPAVVPVLPVQPVNRMYPWGITGLFFVLSLIGIWHHELWRDEFQAWMVAADAHSIPQLFRNLKYEGHPVLWHGFLFIITALTDDPFFMQLFHILVSTAAVYVINRYAPLPWLQKILLSFSYFIFYEYNMISRSYGLSLLLVVLFCAMYPYRRKQLWWIAAVLFLLANCTIFGVILAGGLCAYLVGEEVLYRSKRNTAAIPFAQVWLLAGIVFTGIILGYLQIRPEPDNSFPTLYMTTYDEMRVKEMFSRIMYAYFPIPDFTQLHFWNTNLFVQGLGDFYLGVPIVFVLLWLLFFWKDKLVLMLFSGVTLVLLAFYYYTGLIWSRYAGHLFVILLASYWLFRERDTIRKKLSVGGWQTWMDKLRSPVMTGFLAISFAGGVISYILDIRYPFSTSREAAEFLRENKLDKGLIIGSRDYTISPLATHLQRKIYYAERNEPGSFIIYDARRVSYGGIQDLIPLFKRFYQEGYKQFIFVKDNPVMLVWDDTGERVLWEDAMLTDELNLRLLRHIEPGVVKDEDYYIYIVEEKLKEQ